MSEKLGQRHWEREYRETGEIEREIVGQKLREIDWRREIGRKKN